MKNDYEIRGDVTVIFLDRKDGSRLECLIDTVDLERVQEFEGKWYGSWNAAIQNYYVYGNTLCERTGRNTGILLHRWVTNAPDKIQVDHINNNTLDNKRSSNLRFATDGENKQNRKGAQSNNFSSGIRGVSLHKSTGKWLVQLCVKGKRYYGGLYDDLAVAEQEAISARAKIMPYSKDSPATCVINSDIEILKPLKKQVASSGVKGIYAHCGKWRVRPRINGEMVEIGVFKSLEIAKEKLIEAKIRLEATLCV